jgi:ParB/RepB/Spo0J family partition protein
MQTVSSHQDAVATELVWLDPRTLVGNPANVRGDLRNLDELAESITESGIVEPLVVVPLEEGHRILAGHRRAAAAVMAELDVVPCWVRADLAEAESDQLAAALVENVQRDDLTPLEEAHAYAQLSVFPNWSPGRIAQAAGRDELSVRRGIEATRLAEELQPAAIAGQLSLEEAARLASFADDPETYTTLVRIAGSGGIRHALVRAERERDVARHAAEVRAELEAQGVRIIDRPGHHDVALRLTSLTDQDGGDIASDEHAAGCEGHAVYIDDYDGEAIPVCTDPARFGHGTPQWYRHETEEEAAARIAAEEAAQARRAALVDAATLRQSFIRDLVASKGKPPAGTLRLAVEMLVDEQFGLPAPEDLAWYLGYDDPAELDVAAVLAEAVRKAPERRLPALALAVVAVGAEDNVVSFGNRWGSAALAARRWLSYLVGAGHQLTEAEEQLMDEARKAVDGDR